MARESRRGCRHRGGIAGGPEARDEYESYVPDIFRLLRGAVDGKDVANYLLSRSKAGINTVARNGRARVGRTGIGITQTERWGAGIMVAAVGAGVGRSRD